MGRNRACRPASRGPAAWRTSRRQSDVDIARSSASPDSSVSYATCANLVTSRTSPHPRARASSRRWRRRSLLPTAGGTRYTFRIRPGFRFSPPSNEPVTATTFKSTIERVVEPALEVAGGEPVQRHRRLPGLRHRQGAPALGRRRARANAHDQADAARRAPSSPTSRPGRACAVPRDTPADPAGIDDIPSAGPTTSRRTRRASSSCSDATQLPRRPPAPARPDRRRARRRPAARAPADRGRHGRQRTRRDSFATLDRLEAEYGPGSKAAKQGHQRYFVNPVLGARLLHMNASRPLFSHVRLRRAVNYAIDRPALVAQGLRFANGSPFYAVRPRPTTSPRRWPGARAFTSTP